jgi:predicted 2-oxoglutarate/Fe(II)-dependent dioxygenase YbiX
VNSPSPHHRPSNNIGRTVKKVRRDVLVINNFLESALCEKIRRKSRSAERSPARVGRRRSHTDATIRRTKYLRLPSYERSVVRKRLVSLLPELARRFGVRLSALQRIQFLSYRRGDFFVRHRDASNRPDTEAFIARRKVSVVVFVNSGGSSGKGRQYSGGLLKLYAETGPRPAALILDGEPGLLVAFRSSTLHEVTPVRAGERLTVVGWAC